jgi:hypothetical protein
MAVLSPVLFGVDFLVSLIPFTKHITEVRTIIEKRVKPPEIIYKDRVQIVYRIPGHELDPVNPKDGCEGRKPVYIEDISGRAGYNDYRVHYPGSQVSFLCSIEDRYTSRLSKDTVVLLSQIEQ